MTSKAQPLSMKNGKPTLGKDVVTQEPEFVSERMSMIINATLEDKQTERISAFKKEKTDEERFSHVWASPQIHDVIQLQEEYAGKSFPEAEKFRQKGNKYFQNKSYLSALDSYNRSIVQAPVVKTDTSSDNELALSYGNRSAALFHMKRYRDCLDDMALAEEAGYPQNSMYKLYDRQGKCYLALRENDKAKACFNQALENVQATKLDPKIIGKWKENINNQMVYCEGTGVTDADEIGDKSTLKVPEVSGPLSEGFPALSNNAKVSHTDNKGRHLLAEEEISVGTVLAVEKPFASVLYQEQYGTHCYHCQRKTDRHIPCSQCSTIIYCSQECRQQGWQQYHKYECKYMVLFDKVICARIGQLATRMLMKVGVQPLLEYVRNQRNEAKSENVQTGTARGTDRTGVYKGDYHSIYHLTTHNADLFPITLYDYTVFAAFLTKILLAVGFFKDDEEEYATTENIHLVGSTMLRHLQILQCNALHIEQAVQGCQFDQRGNMEVIGNAIYPTMSLINHACDPAADFNCYGNTIILRSLRNIHPGQPITVSYGPVYFDFDVKQRQQILREVYFFTCDCEPCSEYWPTVTQLEDCVIYFQCPQCHEPIDVSKNPHHKMIPCEACGREIHLEQVVHKLEESHEKVFQSAMVEAFCGRYEKAADKFKQHLSLMQDSLCQPWRDFTSCQLCLKQCYRLMASQ